jgi:CHRD domain
MTRKALVGAALVFCGIIASGQPGESYKARLSAVPADARTRADLTGIGTVTATLTGSRLNVSGTFEGLKSQATAAIVHNGVMGGVRGPALKEIDISKAMTGSITGAVDLNPEQLDHLKKGGLYIQIYSEKAPEGVLWGWLLKQ